MAGRRTLMVAGFLGRGNCGDEAMFQVIYETFAADFEIVASVDEHGAYPGFWDWYPYGDCRIVHRMETVALEFAQERTALLVGGGGLGFGYAANQVIAARCFGAACAFAGVDMPKVTRLHPGLGVAAAGGYLRLFDYVGIRNARGAETARAIGVVAAHAADWSLRLQADTATEAGAERGEVLVALREYGPGMIGPDYGAAVAVLLAGLRARGLMPVLLPFAPEDEAFLARMGLAEAAPVLRQWWNPRRMKQTIGASGGVISVGRLHPLLFAAAARVPVMAVAPPVIGANEGRVSSKVKTMCAELGIAHVDTVAAALAAVDGGAFGVSDAGLLAAGERRLGEMVEALREVFG